MDDNSLLQYENSLKELEKQKETLELVMKRMGAEWEERYNKEISGFFFLCLHVFIKWCRHRVDG